MAHKRISTVFLTLVAGLGLGCSDDPASGDDGAGAGNAGPSGTDGVGGMVVGGEGPGGEGAGAAGGIPEYCGPLREGLVDITDTPASPYLLRHPAASASPIGTVVFLPGGAGDNNTASATFNLWLADGAGIDDFRMVVPYSADGNFLDERDRVVKVLDEVLTCYGGEEQSVHLGGTSNGGVAAFALMLEAPARFTSLLGAPGVFQPLDATVVSAALSGKSVFNGVGENDAAWHDNVTQTHQQLLDLGVDSTYVEFSGERHILSQGFDPSVFFAFWASH